MRYDTRYTRVLGLITDDAIPRTALGGIALCHFCQRQVSFAGGYLELLIQRIERTAKRVHIERCQREPEYRATLRRQRRERARS